MIDDASLLTNAEVKPATAKAGNGVLLIGTIGTFISCPVLVGLVMQALGAQASFVCLCAPAV